MFCIPTAEVIGAALQREVTGAVLQHAFLSSLAYMDQRHVTLTPRLLIDVIVIFIFKMGE